ncbi:mCG144493, partial [Mus musculus]
SSPDWGVFLRESASARRWKWLILKTTSSHVCVPVYLGPPAKCQFLAQRTCDWDSLGGNVQNESIITTSREFNTTVQGPSFVLVHE